MPGDCSGTPRGRTSVRISLNGAVATVAAAAMIVIGVDYVTFAASGDSVILGHLNAAANATTLTRHGPGPVLHLKSAGPNSPALAVDSDAKVRHLNADTVDGRHASSLVSHAVTFKAGARGDVFHGTAFWDLDLAPGVYQASFKASVTPAAGTAIAPVDVICGIADLNTGGQSTHAYTADSASYHGQLPAFMSGAETIRIKTANQPGLACFTSTNSDFKLFKPLSASFTKINSRSVQTASPVRVHGAAQLRLSMLHH
jgi:hypothetical protein